MKCYKKVFFIILYMCNITSNHKKNKFLYTFVERYSNLQREDIKKPKVKPKFVSGIKLLFRSNNL